MARRAARCRRREGAEGRPGAGSWGGLRRRVWRDEGTGVTESTPLRYRVGTRASSQSGVCPVWGLFPLIFWRVSGGSFLSHERGGSARSTSARKTPRLLVVAQKKVVSDGLPSDLTDFIKEISRMF